MAATMGFEHDSIRAISKASGGCWGVLPNSRISAPAMKVRPAQAMMMALTAGSVSARSIASSNQALTAADSALTGGFSTVTTATSPSRATRTTFVDNDDGHDEPGVI